MISATIGPVGEPSERYRRRPFTQGMSAIPIKSSAFQLSGGLAEEFAEVEEVFVAGGALGEFGGLPFVDELLRGHGPGRGEA